MVDAATFVTELEGKHQGSYQQLVGTYTATLTKDGYAVADVLKLEVRALVETIEVAALWLPDSDDLSMKMALAARCGHGARNFQMLGERLAALGVPLASFDPRYGGYSKLFAFFRSLQTTEERAGAGFVTLGGLTAARLEALAGWCTEKGDSETSALYRDRLAEDERRHLEEGRRLLVALAVDEESQARARRATYRTLEVVGEIQDPGLLRKFLTRSLTR